MKYSEEKSELIAGAIVKTIWIFLSIMFLTYILSSCSKQDDGCTCTAKYSNFGTPGYYYISNTPIDCETKRPLKKLSNPNAVFCGCK